MRFHDFMVDWISNILRRFFFSIDKFSPLTDILLVNSLVLTLAISWIFYQVQLTFSPNKTAREL